MPFVYALDRELLVWIGLLTDLSFPPISILCASPVAASYGSTLALSLGCIYSAKFLHETLIVGTMRWPMELFDITPLGRIVNRFSKDVDTVDNTLPLNLRFGVLQLYSVILKI